MIKKALCTVLTLITLSTIGHAETYFVTGSVETSNISQQVQIGEISLTIKNASDDIVFEKSGDLTGVVIGGTTGTTTILSHIASFNKKDRFITSGDVAYITGIINPCSFYVTEHMSNIAVGLGFFKGVTDVDVYATGSISYCSPSDTNQFGLSGTLEME